MKLFQTRKPRGYHHSYMYYDERKQRQLEREERIKRELGLLPPKEFEPEDIRGKFVDATSHLKRRKESGKKYSNTMIIFIVIILLIIFFVLYGY